MSRGKRAATSRPTIETSKTSADADATHPDAAADAFAPATLSVLVYEPGKSNQKRAEELVHGLGYRALVIDTAEDAVKLITGAAPPDVVLAGLPGGESVARAAQQVGSDRPSVLVALSGETADGQRSCDQVGGDSFVLRPYKRDAVAASLRAMATVRFERRRATKLEADLAAERARLLRFGEADPLTGFPHFEFFKKLLVIELKRARRYGYSLAACLVAQDEAPGPVVSAAAQKQVHAQIARLVRTVIRDIDQPVDYADGHFLVFLPYTDLAGAERVGRRLETAVRAAPPVDDGGRRVPMTVSVGIAALKKGREVSFARLIRDASTALRAAQLKGGGRVVVR